MTKQQTSVEKSARLASDLTPAVSTVIKVRSDFYADGPETCYLLLLLLVPELINLELPCVPTTIKL